jgi:hypothetical protein
MKRYMLLIFPNYYPGGGMDDFRGSFDDLNEAFEYSLKWYDKKVDSLYCASPEKVQEECLMQIYDLQEQRIIYWKDGGKDWADEDPFGWINDLDDED